MAECISDGGGPLTEPCLETVDGEVCPNDNAGSSASAWNPFNLVKFSADTKAAEEFIPASVGQTIFTITSFLYTPGTGSLSVHKNGLLLRKGIDWVERSQNSFQLTVPAVAGDSVIASALTAVTGEVVILEVDIYLDNFQAVRDYTGDLTTVYATGKITQFDSGGAFFNFVTGGAPGDFVDDNTNILVPTGGDGSYAWVTKTATYSFKTKADIVAYPAFKIGDSISTDGYLASGDGGDNTYVVVAAGTGVDDGGYYINLTGSNLQAKGLFPGNTYSCNQWGVFADGNTTDLTAGMQNAINTVAANFSKELFLPFSPLSYKCNLVLPNGFSLLGAVSGVTLIPASDAPVITAKPDDEIIGLSVKNINIDGSLTKGSYSNQDGILLQPAATYTMANINITNMEITDCGRRGISMIGGDTILALDRAVANVNITNVRVNTSTINGLYISGNVNLVNLDNFLTRNNGDPTVDLDSNIAIIKDGVAFPEGITFYNSGLFTRDYAVAGTSGSCIVIRGAGNIIFDNCSFYEFNNGLYIADTDNFNIEVRSCRFEREYAGSIQSLAKVDGVTGFIWIGNVCEAGLTGPIGVSINPFGVYTIKNADISYNNYWGSLTLPTNPTVFSVVDTKECLLISQDGEFPIGILGAGPEDLDSILDVNGGASQIMPGAIINVYNAFPTRTITVKHGTGNLQLTGGADITLNNEKNNITLMWNPRISSWIEVSRSVIP